MRTNQLNSTKIIESPAAHRVAEILCNAILRSMATPSMRVDAARDIAAAPKSEAGQASDEKSDDERIICYLKVMRSASPGDIRSALGLSRSTAWRVLRRLTQSGRIVGIGQTRQLVYQLHAEEPPTDKLWQN